MLNSSRHFFAFRFTKNCYENINAKEDEVTTYSFYYAHYKLQNFFISPQSFFPTKTLYIRFLSVYNSHIIKLCKLYFLARSNCTNIFHALYSFYIHLKWAIYGKNKTYFYMVSYI